MPGVDIAPSGALRAIVRGCVLRVELLSIVSVQIPLIFDRWLVKLLFHLLKVLQLNVVLEAHL